jgi:hypothetical protein
VDKEWLRCPKDTKVRLPCRLRKRGGGRGPGHQQPSQGVAALRALEPCPAGRGPLGARARQPKRQNCSSPSSVIRKLRQSRDLRTEEREDEEAKEEEQEEKEEEEDKEEELEEEAEGAS